MQGGDSQDLTFPNGGIDVSTAASEAPAGAAAVGVNVRVNDPFQSRDRGGSRPGLSKWLPARPAGATPTQHLNTVVYYSPDALLATAEQDAAVSNPSAYVTDTCTSCYPDGPMSTPVCVGDPTPGPGGGPDAPASPPFAPNFNRRTPPQGRQRPATGGGGQPNRHVGSPPPVSVPWSFKQQASDGTIASVGGLAVAFGANVTNGALIAVAVATYQAAAPTVSVTDNQGHPYLQAGGYSTVVDAFGNNLTVSLWYTAWNSLAGPATVTVATSTNGAVRVGVAEAVGESYSGSVAAIDGSSAAVDASPAPDPATMTAGTPAVNVASDGLIGAFTTINETDAFTAPAGYTAWITQGGNVGPNLLVVAKLGVSVAEAVTGLVDGYNLYAGVAGSFKKG